jgi:transposase
MGEAYSDDLRQRILRAVDRDLLVRQVCTLFEVSTSFIYKALIRQRTTGETGARARGGRMRASAMQTKVCLGCACSRGTDGQEASWPS